MKMERRFALLRIAFGFIWLIDAYMKWQPAFLDGLYDQISSMTSGQPAWVMSWIDMWAGIASWHPHLLAVLVALIESAIAISLIFGLLTRVGLIVGIAFSLLIWSIGEGFGGPYGPGSTDIGAAIIYAFVLIALFVGASWRTYSLDSFLSRRWPDFFLWRDVAKDKSVAEATPRLTRVLILTVVVLGSMLLVTVFPSQSSVKTGPGAMAPMGMMLKTYEIPAAYPTPTVDFTITRDPVSMGGWDVHITTTNFLFTPQDVNGAPVPDQGHVHLYVDDTLHVVYGLWYHLDDLQPGTHIITVALAQNDHSIYTKNGQQIEKKETITQ